MTTEKLRQLIQQPEGVKLEFKQELYHIDHPDKNVRNMQWDEFIKDILALANGNVGTVHETGYLIIGIEDKTKRLYDVGDVDTKEFTQQLLAKLRSACHPNFPNIRCELVELEGVRVLILTIPPTPYVYETTRRLQTSPNTYYNEKSVFIRSGDSICLAGQEERTNILEEKQQLFSQHLTGSYNVQKYNSNVTFDNVSGGIHDSTIAGRDINLNINFNININFDKVIVSHPDTSSMILASEYQAEIDHSRGLLNNYKPQEALDYLEKLKNRIWSNAQPIVKYRILTNMGSAKLLQNHYQKAASQFIEALQYNPDDEKALCNVALGYLLLEQFEEVQTYTKKVLAKNPANSRAYSFLIQALPDTEKLEDIIAKVPESYRTTSEVAFAIGVVAHNRKQLVDTKQWLEIAIEHDQEEHPEQSGELGGVLLELAIQPESTLNGVQLTNEQKEQIQQAVELLDSALKRVTHAPQWKLRVGWLLNRGLAKLFLGDLEGAIRDTDHVLEVEPSNPEVIRRRAMLAYDSGDSEKAITLLKSILSVQEPLDAALLLAHILRSTQRASEAVAVLHDFLNTHPDIGLQEKARRELIKSYIALRDFEHARELSESIRTSHPDSILNLVAVARIAVFEGNRDEALSLLQEAKLYLTSSSPVQQQLELANAFYALKEFEDAARIYEYFVDPSLDTQLTFQLLMSYYEAGETNNALTVCRTLRQKYGILKHITDMEASIYEEIGDLLKAKQTAQEYLELFPEHFDMELLVAVVNSRIGNLEGLDHFLRSASYADVERLHWKFGIWLAYLYTERHHHRRAIEILFELRKKFPEQGIIHRNYIQSFTFLPESKDSNDWLLPTRVDVGTAVCLQRSSGESDWYFIVEHQDADILHKRFSSDHPIAQKLSGKKNGDEIVLKESVYSQETVKITEIKSKYIYALHESLDSYETLFPDIPGFLTIAGTDEEKTEKILKIVANHHKTYLDIEQWYNEGRFPLGAFADLIGRNVIDVWESLTNKPEVGIKCCYGTLEERNVALSLLEDTPKLIIDIIALLTLHHIQAADAIADVYGKLGIAQATVDLLQHVITMRKEMESEGFSTFGKEGDHFIMEEISAEQVQQKIAYLECLRKWVEDNCEVLPCHAALHIKRTRKKELEETIGKAFVDTILIASEPGRILYSDDERLRAFAKAEHNVDGVWTQVLLMNCVNNNLLEKKRYHEMVIKLVTSHYCYTTINAEILIEAAKQADWSPSERYTTVVEVLRGGSADEKSALRVGTNFLYELSNQPIWYQPVHRDAFMQSVFQALTTGRNPGRTLDKLETQVRRQSAFSPSAAREILSLIDVWRQTHII